VLTFLHDFVNAEDQSDVNQLMDFIPIWLLDKRYYNACASIGYVGGQLFRVEAFYQLVQGRVNQVHGDRV